MWNSFMAGNGLCTAIAPLDIYDAIFPVSISQHDMSFVNGAYPGSGRYSTPLALLLRMQTSVAKAPFQQS